MGKRTICTGGFAGILWLSAHVCAAQAVEDRPDLGFLTQDVVYSRAQIEQRCATPLGLNVVASIQESTCQVEQIDQLGASENGSWYAAHYDRSAIVEWASRIESVDWVEMVLFNAATHPDSLMAVWHLRTVRTFESIDAVRAQERPDGFLIEVVVCRNATGTCVPRYLIERPSGLGDVNALFVPQLQARLEDGRRLAKGMSLDLETLHGTWPVAAPSDPLCCPSEVLDYEVRLDGYDMVLVRAALR